MEGRSKVSIDAARKLVTKTPKAMLAKVPRLERYFVVPYFSLIRFGEWDKVLQEAQPDESMKYAQVMWHYARGMAFANKGKIKKAKKELKLVEAGIMDEAIIALDMPNFPTVNLSKMAALVLKGEIAGKKGKYKEKITQLEAAVTIQDGLRYSEPPHFYIPLRQALGVAHLEANNPIAAERVYKEDLVKFPNNGWSLFGLHQSLILQNKKEEADAIKSNFDKAWKQSDVVLERSVM